MQCAKNYWKLWTLTGNLKCPKIFVIKAKQPTQFREIEKENLQNKIINMEKRSSFPIIQ